jgi:recombination protein RecT
MSQGVPKQKDPFLVLLDQSKAQIAAALPKHMHPDRMLRVALTEFRKNPGLKKCQPVSVFKCFIEAAQLGLEPGVQGQGYLIPFKEECTFIPGYRGLIQLARRSDEISVIDAQAVFEGDLFECSLGTEPKLSHTPKWQSDIATHYYAVCILKDGGKQFVVMSREQVERHRDQYSKQWKASGKGPWLESFDEMAKKTLIRRLCKMIPQSVELADALQYEDDKAKENAIEVEFTDDELKANREKIMNAPEVPTSDAKAAAIARFERVYETCCEFKIETSDLFKSTNEVLLSMPEKILAICNVLESRIPNNV